MPDEETPTSQDSTEETPQPEDAAEQSPDEQPAAEAPTEESEPLTAAEQLAQDALQAAQAAVSGINSGDPIESPQADNAQSAIAAAQHAVDGIGSHIDDAIATTTTLDIPDLTAPVLDGELEEGLDFLADVNLNVKIELGRTRMYLEDVLKLSEGSVVELDKLAGDPVDIYVNDRHVATGEVLILNDNFCVRINDIISSTAPENRSA